MSTTLTQLQNLTFNLLNEDTDSVVGEVGTNNANSPEQTTLATFTQLLNYGSALLCKSGIALFDTGTYSYPLNTQSVLLADLTTTTTGTMWAPVQVTWNGAALQKMDQAYADLNFPAGSATGTPEFWVPIGQYGIQLLPVPSTTESMTAWGLITSPPLVSGSDELYGIQDSEAIYLAYYAAYLTSEKNIESPNLQLKIPIWKQQFEACQQRLWAQLLNLSPQIAMKYFSPPAALPEVSESNPQ